jgi:hypothetical protein
MQTPCKPVAAAFLALVLYPSSFILSQVPLRWIAEAQRPAAQNWDVYQGETALLLPELREAGTAVAWTGAETATLYWQTNGMDTLWWSAPAEVVTNTAGLVRATWSPTNDVGAAQYPYFVGVSGSSGGRSYRANGTLKMKRAPGATPNSLPLPARVIDFATVTVSNAPWATPGYADAVAAQALTNAQGYADAVSAYAQTNAQGYADTVAAHARTNAQDYAAAVAAQAQTNAQGYAAAVAAQARTNAQDYAAAVAAQAQTNAQGYADAAASNAVAGVSLMGLASDDDRADSLRVLVSPQSVATNLSAAADGDFTWADTGIMWDGDFPVSLGASIHAATGLWMASYTGSNWSRDIWLFLGRGSNIVAHVNGVTGRDSNFYGITNNNWYGYNYCYDPVVLPVAVTGVFDCGNGLLPVHNGLVYNGTLSVATNQAVYAAVATTNQVAEAVAAISWPSLDSATNILWTVSVSNGHWLIIGTEVTP